MRSMHGLADSSWAEEVEMREKSYLKQDNSQQNNIYNHNPANEYYEDDDNNGKI